jgi:glycine cleavage system H protein
MTIPVDLMYTREHEWIRFEGDLAIVGITAYAADALGDVVFVELPEPGTLVIAGDPCGEIESTKSVSDLVSPAAGEVLETNAAVLDEPSLVNSDPYGHGWLIQIRVVGDLTVLDHVQYARHLGEVS